MTRQVKYLASRLVPEKVLTQLVKPYYARLVQSFAEKELDIVKVLVAPGDYVIDVGANIGWYTRPLAHFVGDSGRVYSIEPVPRSFDILRFCTKKLRLQNVTLLNCAISDRAGAALMEIPTSEWDRGRERERGWGNYYNARLVEDQVAARAPRTLDVRLTSLDAMFLDLPKAVTFIKCDVEGHELWVLRGARRLISRARPAWLLEAANPDDPASRSWQVFKYLEELGYAPYWYDGARLIRRSPGDRSQDYFFLTPQHLALIPGGGMPIQQTTSSAR